MRREIMIAVAIFGAGALFYFTRARAGQQSGDDYEVPLYDAEATDGPISEGIMMGTSDPNANLLAFLALIRQFESGGNYSIIYGGGHFSSFTDHPRKRVPINLPGYEGKYSSAAGAYQFIESTWDRLAERLGLQDFSPAAQDAAAVELLRQLGALGPIQAGDFDTAMHRASGTWASLPYSNARQNPVSVARANDFLQQYLT